MATLSYLWRNLVSSQGLSWSRNFYTSRGLTLPVEKSALAKLRKATGYSFTRCKEALEKHSNDLKIAEKWLREEAQTHGWEKATKLQGRATAQGLVSVLASTNKAVMLEMNCETDFVARNKKFQSLVQKITQACYNECGKSTDHSEVFRHPLDSDKVSNIPIDERSIKDEIAVSIGEIGENIKGRRALFMQAKEPIHLSGYTHPAASPESEKHKTVQLGKFGAIVAYKVVKGATRSATELEEIGRQLCQHVVGMNPVEIGSLDAPPPKKKEPPPPPTPPIKSENEDGLEEEGSFQISSTPEVDETVLLNQEFLLDPELTVREFLIQNSIQVLDFVRFECGESLAEAGS